MERTAGCGRVGEIGPGTKAISLSPSLKVVHPNPNTATTFLSENDKRGEGGQEGGEATAKIQRSQRTFFPPPPMEDFA